MIIVEKEYQRRKKELKFNTKKGKKFSDFLTEEDINSTEQDVPNTKRKEKNNENNGCDQ
nr:hypothetical protein [uncultured Blautia sp.]